MGFGGRFGIAGLILAGTFLSAQARSDEARIIVDAAQVEGQIDTRLYGQFAEFMYKGVKGGREIYVKVVNTEITLRVNGSGEARP
jgi:hypothetical protein